MLVYDIEVTPDQLEKLLTQRECATLERKESARELPRSLFESVCTKISPNPSRVTFRSLGDYQRGEVPQFSPCHSTLRRYRQASPSPTS